MSNDIVSVVVTEDPRPLLAELLRLLLDTRDHTLKIAVRYGAVLDDAEGAALSVRAVEMALRVQRFSASMRDGAVS